MRRYESSYHWTWRDECRVMVHLPESAFRRYVETVSCRRVDFEDEPIKPSWTRRFLRCAEMAAQQRAQR